MITFTPKELPSSLGPNCGLLRDGTTCGRYNSIHSVFEVNDHTFVVRRHVGHTAYVDRMTGSVYCEGQYRVYSVPLLEELLTKHRILSVWNLDKALIFTGKGRWGQRMLRELRDAIYAFSSAECFVGVTP